MKRINQELKFEDNIELRLTGDTYLSIEQSSRAVEEIEIDYDENHVAIHVSENLVEVIDDTKKSINAAITAAPTGTAITFNQNADKLIPIQARIPVSATIGQPNIHATEPMNVIIAEENTT